MVKVVMKQLLEAGVHFGHQPRKWNPKMKPYIFTSRKNLHIIDLQQTMRSLKNALAFTTELTSKGEYLLFVGTKKQAQATIEEQAKRCGMPYVNQRWLGGTLTNFETIRKSVLKLLDLRKKSASGFFDKLANKEASKLKKELQKKEKLLSGIANMDKLPGALFLIDPKRDEIAVFEARKLKIPVIGVMDSNCDPDLVDIGIPGNDDAIRAIKLFCESFAEAVIEGRTIYEQTKKAETEAKTENSQATVNENDDIDEHNENNEEYEEDDDENY
ncbi:MAG TPA: 30S ribosomal protein S2 [bacterium]|nr:30S ribosomal protein S2 [bacterium]HOL46890.1 30S ribosomal protein S2 [bacterium]HPQ18761.1 30S ribosomal protein S2 [bacterium]